MQHTRGAPYHPMTEGKIKGYHRSIEIPIQPHNCAFQRDAEREIDRFVEYYNRQRHHESLDNVTPADVSFGRVKEIPTKRKEIKRTSSQARGRQYTLLLMLAA